MRNVPGLAGRPAPPVRAAPPPTSGPAHGSRRWRGPGWVGRLALAGAAAGLVLAHGAGAARPAAEMGRAAAPGEPAVLLAGAALGGGSPVVMPTVRAGATPAAAPGAAGDATPRIVAAATAFLATLNDAQRTAAIFSFDDTTAKAQWSNFPSCCYPWLGVRMGDLTPAQQALLVDLIARYVGLLNAEDAAAKLAEAQATLADTYFAWYGPTAPGSAAYFRVQGPALWIEFSPQGGGGGPGGLGLGGAATANHVHAIYRDQTNDYGAKLIIG